MPATIPSDILWSPVCEMAWFQAATMSSLLYISASVSTEAAAVVYDTALSPAPAVPLNLIEILMKACQYNAFMRLLKDTEVSSQVASLLDGAGGRNAHGVTGLTPTDAAFAGMRPGTLNRMDAQLQLTGHHQPRAHAGLDPARRVHRQRDQTTGGGERQQVNVLAGMAEATLGRPLYSAYPLAVYSVDTSHSLTMRSALQHETRVYYGRTFNLAATCLADVSAARVLPPPCAFVAAARDVLLLTARACFRVLPRFGASFLPRTCGHSWRCCSVAQSVEPYDYFSVSTTSKSSAALHVGKMTVPVNQNG
ncbi:hypothetical protein EJB05_24050, partial [Eragrostis curvula]